MSKRAGPRASKSWLRRGALLALLSLGACAQAVSGDQNDTPSSGDAGSTPPSSTGSGDTSYPSANPGAGDGDLAGNGQPGSNSVDVTSGDAGATFDLNSLGNLFGNVGASDAGTPDVGDGGMCQGLVCFDVFDCYILHPNEATTCGFTACEAFICK
jgi:hypothetical protein